MTQIQEIRPHWTVVVSVESTVGRRRSAGLAICRTLMTSSACDADGLDFRMNKLLNAAGLLSFLGELVIKNTQVSNISVRIRDVSRYVPSMLEPAQTGFCYRGRR